MKIIFKSFLISNIVLLGISFNAKAKCAFNCKKFLLFTFIMLFNSNASGSEITYYKSWALPQWVKPEPNYETLKHYGKKYIRDINGFSYYEINPSGKTKELHSNLKKNDFLKSQMETTGLLSYLYWDNNKIIYDEISKPKRFGKIFNNKTHYPSMSIGKTFVSYILGHAICDGYIKNIYKPITDWPLIKNSVYYKQSLLDLLNMRARDKKFVDDDKGLKKTKRWYNNHSLKSFIDNELKGTKKPSGNWNDEYHYNGLVTRIIINYVIHKTNQDYQKLLEKIFIKKVGIENAVRILKSSKTIKLGTFSKNKIPSENDGVSRYTHYVTRYDYLRIAISILNDWKSNNCVGRYLKKVYDERKPKNKKIRNPSTGSAKGYGGQFHTDYIEMEGRNILGMDGYGGQQIIIDLDNSRIVVVQTIHKTYDWYNLVHQVIKNGRLSK